MVAQDWWRGAVIYQIYPRSFADSNGDGVGDLAGITAHLGHVADLGVDAVWLSPVFPSPMKDMGYDVSDYRDIEPTFGTLGDFDALVEEAHRLGLKLVIDQVLSHSSDRHPFFQESRKARTGRYADWYVWADPRHDGTAPNNWLSVFGGISWEWEPRRHQYYLHNFLKEQPDFNYYNPEVQDYHLETLKFWLERGVDGFRLDAVNHYFHDRLLRDNPADYRVKTKPDANPADMQYPLFSRNQPENLVYVERIRKLLDSYGARTSIGEVGDFHHPIEMMAEYTAKGRLHMAYASEMMGDEFGAKYLRSAVERFIGNAPEGWATWAFSNHDTCRHVTRWAGHAADPDSFAKLCATLILSFQGSICLYQGEELGQEESELAFEELTDPGGINFWPESKGRDGCRTPMTWDSTAPYGGFSTVKPWLPVKPPQLAHALDRQTGDDSVLAHYQHMLALRRSAPELRTGETVYFHTEEPVLAFTRGDKYVCVFNTSADAAQFGEDVIGEPVLVQNARLRDGGLELGPNGFMIALKK
jgi:alpha-glucosidase